MDLARGLRCLAAGQLDQAEEHFARAHRRAPDQPEVLFALGRERLRKGRVDEAEPLLRGAWDRDRTLGAAAAGLARCLGVAGDQHAASHAILDEAMVDPVHAAEPGLHVVRGEIYLEEERVAEARAAFEEAERRLAGSRRDAPVTRSAVAAGLARVYNLDGIELGRASRTEEALFAFKRAADLDPEWSGPVVNMGVAFAQLGRAARARSCYERALAADPENPVARFNLANLTRDGGDLARAEADYEAVLELDAEYPGARAALADVLLRRGEAARAVAHLERLATEHPDDAGVWFQLGVAHDQGGDPGAAERSLRRALALDQDHVPACCRLAALLTRDGRYLEAAALARRAHELDPARAQSYLGSRPSEP